MNKHLVKIIGVLVAVLGFIQAYPGLKNMLAPSTYAWIMVGVGLVLAGLGVLRKVETDNWLTQWKTVLVGVVTAVVSAAQGMDLTNLLSANAYGWAMFALGVAAVVCGVLNSMADEVVPT